MKQTQIWFTSDHHFGHKNIITYSKRPFETVEQMNQELINRWNAKVAPNDEVYHLGDFAFLSPEKLRTLRTQLNGKIYLIQGNHDTSALQCADCFEWIKEYHELVIEDPEAHKGKRLIILLHYAMRVWNVSHHGSWHLYGHSHGMLADDSFSLSFDAGVDCHNFYPISYEEVKQIMNQKQWVAPFERRG
jgi:calcineurin-like phosphoesterase family protein